MKQNKSKADSADLNAEHLKEKVNKQFRMVVMTVRRTIAGAESKAIRKPQKSST